MFTPKKLKHRKWRKRLPTGVETRGTQLAYGSYGLKAVGSSRVTDRQLEAARRSIVRYLKKGGKMWVRIFPHHPVTKKPAEVPMGGGTGTLDYYAFPVRPGRVIFELDGIPEDQAKEALLQAGDKLSVKTKFIRAEE